MSKQFRTFGYSLLDDDDDDIVALYSSAYFMLMNNNIDHGRGNYDHRFKDLQPYVERLGEHGDLGLWCDYECLFNLRDVAMQGSMGCEVGNNGKVLLFNVIESKCYLLLFNIVVVVAVTCFV